MNNIVYDTPRKDEINNFLQYLYQIKKQHNMIDKPIVYHALRNYALKETDFNEDYPTGQEIDDFFKKWQKDFEFTYEKCEKNEGVVAYVDPSWTPFCQFANIGDLIDPKKEKEFIKIYVPLDKDHIYEGVKKIFEYMESKKMAHCSKVLHQIGSDDVVIRLRSNDEENAQLIMNFIDNDAYIKEGLNKTNPFVPTYKGIGIMKESGLSYNGILADMLAKYIDKKYHEQKEPNYEDLVNYMKNIKTFNIKEQETKDIFNNQLISNDNEKENIVSQNKANEKYIINADPITGKINWVGVNLEDENIFIERIINNTNSEEYIPQLIKINQKYGGDFFDNINNKKVKYVKQTFFEEELRKRFSEIQAYEEKTIDNASSGRSR